MIPMMARQIFSFGSNIEVPHHFVKINLITTKVFSRPGYSELWSFQSCWLRAEHLCDGNSL